jgi:hypothetical protein
MAGVTRRLRCRREWCEAGGVLHIPAVTGLRDAVGGDGGWEGEAVNETTGLSLILLTAGTVIALVTLLRIKSGKSYFGRPPARVSRQGDPFSFWLSVGIPGVLAVLAIVAGLAGVLFGAS